ncbi:hypothetical protein PYCCODRAFT_1469687 [Trametes coccinea BRFM310]|uniref:Uncharacterized protein n=1 Tax=Trametes coccinea (strain BRFM310) TaxID=1353009 RepID=A0A1Y2IGB2_TRAC3|nr:hypothetical protein PYCCODRAFT_1469687 [Trametes coccinea BRFM310]
MENAQSTRLQSLVEIMFLGPKLAQDIMSPGVCQAENLISRVFAERMTSVIPRFVPEAHPDSLDRVVTMRDLIRCIEDADNDLDYAVEQVFKMPTVQETMRLWTAFAFEYVDALHATMRDALCSNLRTHLPSSEEVAKNVQTEIKDYLAALESKAKSAISNIIQCNRRPFTMRVDELKEYAARFEQDHLATSAYLECAQPGAHDYTAYMGQIRVMAKVHAYFQIMYSRTCDMVVKAAWCEVWDGFANSFGDHIMDKAYELVDSVSK